MDVDEDEEDALFGADDLHLEDLNIEDSGVVINVDQELDDIEDEEDEFEEEEEIEPVDEDTRYFYHDEDGWLPAKRSAQPAPSSTQSSQQKQPNVIPEDVPVAPDAGEAGRRTLEANLREPTYSVRYGGFAGAPIPAPVDAMPKEKIKHGFTMYGPPPGEPDDNIYAPFASRTNWLFARWAKMRGPGSTAMTELLRIPLVKEKLGLSYSNANELNRIIDTRLHGRAPRFKRAKVEMAGESFDLYFRDILECVRALYGNPDFARYLVFQPEKVYSEANNERLYHDMYTGTWWWATQRELEKEKPGATIIPLIISSDKAQVTTFGNKSAYPVYLTIGNLPKEIRRKPSRQGQMLLAYLPTTHLNHIPNKAARRRIVLNIFHKCLRTITEPLKAAGLDGMPIASGDGVWRRGHPIYAVHVGDYPEQANVVGCKHGECPQCDASKLELGVLGSYSLRDLEAILDAHAKYETDPAGFAKACREAGVKAVIHPFWEHLPYCNIFQSIMPDILHQILQGMLKHLVVWIKTVYSTAELDARCKALPRNSHVRHFFHGISPLSCVTGKEHNDVARILLGLIIDLRLPNGMSSARLLKATRAMLDFLFLSQYPVQSDGTLQRLENALTVFHDNKQIFIDLGIRKDFNFPKLHSFSHYVPNIKWKGSADNFDTAYAERLHIDLTKDAYQASNHRDELPQMTRWVEHKEKILHFAEYIAWREGGSRPFATYKPPIFPTTRIKLPKTPSRYNVQWPDIESLYGAAYIKDAIARYIAKWNSSNAIPAQIEAAALDIHFPVDGLPVYHRVGFWLGHSQQHPLSSNEYDSIVVKPKRIDTLKRIVPARFDTALINGGDSTRISIEGEPTI
ncbi:hypothetical protein PsYK624_169850 [Phanerochaete sordida]|uniref:Transposase domain-containing protein n=1 Tax=Phanerochaete sordida TaxID=48140 RepID=A0A9P3GSW9_9APHY|nr:hypothetical protein PsYK624_169850 [Phanerochaete sordida]